MGASSQPAGYNYRVAWHDGLGKGPWDAFTEFRGADKTAWKGRVEANTAIPVVAPNLWGGKKDQGGPDGTLTPMFGLAGQLPNAALVSMIGPKITASRGMMTVAWHGIWGANNPFQQKRSYRGERTYAGWDNDDCWYPATVRVPIEGDFSPGSPGAGSYRWAMKHNAYVAASPDGVDWSDTTALTPGAGSEVNFGNYIVSTAPNGDTSYALYTNPGVWIPGPNVGATAMLFCRVSVVNGEVWHAKGTAGYAHASNPAGPYTLGEGRTWLVAGNADYIVRYAGANQVFYTDGFWFYRSVDGGDTWEHISTLELGAEGDDDYYFYLDASASNDSRLAFAGADYSGNTKVYWSTDGFATKSESTMPAGQLGQVRELLHVTGAEWLAFVYGGVCDEGPSAVLRSTDNLASFQTVDLGLAETVTFGHVFQGNAAVDRTTGQVVFIADPDGGGTHAYESSNRTSWQDIPLTFGPNTIYLIGPNDPGTPPTYGRIAKNPAHMILEMHTQKHCGRQPRDSVNLGHLTTQADWFYSRGFGLCTVRNPKETSPREFIKRIEQVAGCSFTKSLADGLWYLDVANGIYDLDSLPIITDDDVLKFKETASTSDNVVNSVSVKYFDPERNEIVITPPIKAMGLIAQFGEIHQTFEYLEIPIGRIALEVAERELLARITPTRAFELDCLPTVYELRRNQPVRLQLLKRGIADMVCYIAEIPTSGSLKSGAFQLKLAQDIYSLPSTQYVVELGEDTSPPPTPAEIVDQVAFEASYIDVVASMPAADFAALPADAGYVVGAAVDPGRMRDFTMMVAPDGGEYDDVGDGQFCPSCTSTGLVEPGLELGIGYSGASRMASVQIGDLGYWPAADGTAELVRVDAHDMDLQTLDLGRGCGDTIPKRHLAGSRIFFYQSAAAFDRTQHIAGEALDVKLLTNSYSEQQDIDDATLLPVTMVERIARPYPNGRMEINGVSIFAIGTSSPGGGGGGGPGGGGPTAPPAQSPGGGPASPVPGPYNGFPDNAPYPVPPPPVGGDVIDDGGFDTPGYPTGWTNADGTPLDYRWFVDADGKLHYQGVGPSKAYYLGARFSLPWQPIPRYDIAASADIATESPAKAAVGSAWGVSTAGSALNYESLSEMKEYPVEETVPHSFIHAPSGLVAGISYVDQIPIVTFVPVLSIESSSGLVVNVTFDNVSVLPSIISMPTTPAALPNLDFSSGLTGWSMYPDPTGNPHAPTIVASGGELSMTTNSPFWKLQNFIHDTALSPNEIGRYTGTDFESWSDDTTVVRGFTQGGVIIGFAFKYLGVVAGIVYSGAFQRGDWTARQTWLRQHVDGTVTPGVTLHHLVALRAEPTFTSAIRNQSVFTTDDIIDPVPIP